MHVRMVQREEISTTQYHGIYYTFCDQACAHIHTVLMEGAVSDLTLHTHQICCARQTVNNNTTHAPTHAYSDFNGEEHNAEYSGLLVGSVWSERSTTAK